MPDTQSVERPHEALARDLRENDEKLEWLLGPARQPLSGNDPLVFLRFSSSSQVWERRAEQGV
ncbi:hypothetical protein ACEZCY_32995 [Streptacidiphilus sp. N1-12]|uniref:Uncharacterized protein n=2 Tax=Streptacidiphilus alkalitolerans TaxID=3342712 RepID=A0ABV6VK56_9ACTN